MTELIVYGVVLGSIIALGAIGLTLLYGILRFAHFAHGDLMTLGAYVASWTTRRAAERAIEIISEASRRLPEPLKASEPDVPWRDASSSR